MHERLLPEEVFLKMLGVYTEELNVKMIGALSDGTDMQF